MRRPAFREPMGGGNGSGTRADAPSSRSWAQMHAIVVQDGASLKNAAVDRQNRRSHLLVAPMPREVLAPLDCSQGVII
jgi:hypothetical protein